MARVVGSLSPNLRVQKVRLHAGWNLCSLAVSLINALPRFSAVLGYQPLVVQWDPSAGTWLTVAYGEPLRSGTVLWLNAETNGMLAMLGSYLEPTNRLIAAAGSFQPGAGFEAWDFRYAISDQPVYRVSAYDAGRPPWLSWLLPPLEHSSDLTSPIAPGEAFYLSSVAPLQLEVPEPSLRICYYHQDHLGSSTVISENQGAGVEEAAYYPFGRLRNENHSLNVNDPYRFTQKEQDKESGLHYFSARFLASHLSRFATADPKYANPETLTKADLQSFLAASELANAYSHTINNPVRWIDFDGRAPGDPFETADAAAMDVLKSISSQSILFNVEYGGWIYQDPKSKSYYATKPTMGDESGLPGGNSPFPAKMTPSANTIRMPIIPKGRLCLTVKVEQRMLEPNVRAILQQACSAVTSFLTLIMRGACRTFRASRIGRNTWAPLAVT